MPEHIRLTLTFESTDIANWHTSTLKSIHVQLFQKKKEADGAKTEISSDSYVKKCLGIMP